MPVITGHLHVDPARPDEFVAAHRDLIRRARGCLDLAITADCSPRGG